MSVVVAGSLRGIARFENGYSPDILAVKFFNTAKTGARAVRDDRSPSIALDRPWNFPPKTLQNVKRTLISPPASVNSQLVNPKIPLSRLLLFLSGALLAMGAIFLGFHLFQMSDPYDREVLALPGNASRGYEIFQINCAGCHGKFGDGSVGPSLHEVSKRKSKISLIEQVVSGQTPPMPKFQPDPQEMADLLIYLEHL